MKKLKKLIIQKNMRVNKMEDFTQILPRVFLGACDPPICNTRHLIHNCGVSIIVNMTPKGETPSAPQAFAEQYRFPITMKMSDTDIKASIIGAAKQLRQSVSLGKSVYVHCYEGVNRSASVVVWYVMTEYSLTFQKASAFVSGKRPSLRIQPRLAKLLRSMAKSNSQSGGSDELIVFQRLLNDFYSVDTRQKIKVLKDLSQGLAECTDNGLYLESCTKFQTVCIEVERIKFLVKSRVFPTSACFDHSNLLSKLQLINQMHLSGFMKFYGSIKCSTNLPPHEIKKGLKTILTNLQFCSHACPAASCTCIYFYEFIENSDTMRNQLNQLNPDSLVQICKALFEMLRIAQDKIGFVHNDLNLRNVLITQSLQPFLVDFDDCKVNIDFTKDSYQRRIDFEAVYYDLQQRYPLFSEVEQRLKTLYKEVFEEGRIKRHRTENLWYSAQIKN